VASSFEIRVAGQLPATVHGMIRLRFGDIAVRVQAPLTVLTGLVLDQSQLRALLSLIWDSGGSVLYVALTTEPALPDHERQR
jgi:hypothetical protein